MEFTQGDEYTVRELQRRYEEVLNDMEMHPAAMIVDSHVMEDMALRQAKEELYIERVLGPQQSKYLSGFYPTGFFLNKIIT